MTSCRTIWTPTSHMRHPWFDQQLKKRKHSSRTSMSRTPSPEHDPTSRPPSKRRRCSILEHGFAHLTLDNPFMTVLPETAMFTCDCPSAALSSPQMEDIPSAGRSIPQELDSRCSTTCDLRNVVYPSSVEEPSIPEIEMKPSGWFEIEPDRIVITDLDAVSDDEEPQEAKTSLTVNSMLLKQIRKNSLQPTNINRKEPSQALVLFKPLPRPGDVNLVEAERFYETGREVEGDAMDIEY